MRPLTLVALAALAIVAVGGTATAATLIDSGDIQNDSVKSKDIRNNNLKSKDVRNGTLKSTDVRNGTLQREDLGFNVIDGITGPRGPAGPAGAAGAQGPAGPAGPAGGTNQVRWFITMDDGDAPQVVATSANGQLDLIAVCDSGSNNTHLELENDGGPDNGVTEGNTVGDNDLDDGDNVNVAFASGSESDGVVAALPNGTALSYAQGGGIVDDDTNTSASAWDFGDADDDCLFTGTATRLAG
jgi:hypothetical protein